MMISGVKLKCIFLQLKIKLFFRELFCRHNFGRVQRYGEVYYRCRKCGKRR